MTTQSIAQQEIQRSIDLTGFWGKPEVRDALRELLERISYRESRESNGDYLRGYRDGMDVTQHAGSGVYYLRGYRDGIQSATNGR